MFLIFFLWFVKYTLTSVLPKRRDKKPSNELYLVIQRVNICDLNYNWNSLLKNGQWQNSRNGGRFLFPVKALSKVFRAKYYAKIKSKLPIQYEQIRKELWQKPGVVFAKKPFMPKWPFCKTVTLHRIAVFDQRCPPAWYLGGGQNLNPCEN